jgi:hypothetical protein
MTMVASSLHAKVELGEVKKPYFIFVLDILDFGLFLKLHFKVRNKKFHALKAL